VLQKERHSAWLIEGLVGHVDRCELPRGVAHFPDGIVLSNGRHRGHFCS
jgi:hypothetical protein